jgi:hypothetical protein
MCFDFRDFFSLTFSIKVVQSVSLLCNVEASMLHFPGSVTALYSMEMGFKGLFQPSRYITVLILGPQKLGWRLPWILWHRRCMSASRHLAT